MPIDELIDDRSEIFRRPKSKKEVIGGRTSFLEIRNFKDIAPTLSNRRANQVGVITFQIIPPNFYSPQNFSKRGPLVELNTFNGDVSELVNNQWSDLKARIQASEEYSREEGSYVGWMW